MNILVFSLFCAHDLLYQSPGTGVAPEAGKWIKKMSLAEAKQSLETLPVHLPKDHRVWCLARGTGADSICHLPRTRAGGLLNP